MTKDLTEKNATEMFGKLDLEENLLQQLITFITKMYKLAEERDAKLVEINPLVVTEDDELIAVDSKVSIDDNALFRQREFPVRLDTEKTAIEKAAQKKNIAYVELDGDIAVIGNGAGLVMATLDSLGPFRRQTCQFPRHRRWC